MDLKVKLVGNEFFKEISSNEDEYLNKNFYFYRGKQNDEFIKGKSKYILAYNSGQIVGMMKISRYLIENCKAFQEEYKQEFDFEESDNYSLTDTYIHIAFAEVREDFRRKGVGSAMYKYLEDILTTLDIVYESKRTIDGKKADLLNKISKCMAVDDFDLVYCS